MSQINTTDKPPPSSPLIKPQQSPSPTPSGKNIKRFRAAHASFRLRMLHEQNAPVRKIEPVCFGSLYSN
ncbi:unnamed protein product [Meloidogyne enterolobii]|uniref:Uncharacterized protein n=1 Tax=Meloidogyne enterolobii TaxID=390850 RepID=A0ACB0YND5_MELEN